MNPRAVDPRFGDPHAGRPRTAAPQAGAAQPEWPRSEPHPASARSDGASAGQSRSDDPPGDDSQVSDTRSGDTGVDDPPRAAPTTPPGGVPGQAGASVTEPGTPPDTGHAREDREPEQLDGHIGRLALPTTTGGKLVAVAVVLAIAAAAAVGARFGAPSVLASLSVAANPVVTSAPPPPAPLDPQLRALGGGGNGPTPAGVAAAIDGLASVPALGSLAGVVVDGQTGAELWSRTPGAALVPGSTAKIVSGAAALLAIDHTATLTTTVVAGAEPGTVVLVGGGDPTLSALPAGEESVYPGAPKLDDLVAQVRAANPGPVTRVLVDVSRWSDESMGPGWDPIDIGAGYIAPLVPVMLDGGRAVPTVGDTPRSSTPARTAAAELARRLGADPSTVAVGDAPPDARVLATVNSRPVEDLVEQMLQSSDNVLAEALAREVAVTLGQPTTFAGSMAAVHSTLQQAGIDVSGLRTVDGSGLSAQNTVTAAGLVGLLMSAVSGSAPLLGPLTGGLPVAGGSGSLADRYGDPAARGGRGYVRAKTGTLSGVNSLAGIVVDADGRLLVFALLSNGSVSTTARPALDAVAAALRSCGCG